MTGRWLRITVTATCAGLVVPWLGLAAPADASPAGGAELLRGRPYPVAAGFARVPGDR